MARLELARLDAMAQAELVARKEVSGAELFDACITRIEALNPLLRAVVTAVDECPSPYARRLLESGLVCVGKSATSELGLLASSESLLEGTPRGRRWCPARSVPLSSSATGLPIGAHFAAAPGADALLLGLAYQLEQARPWRDRWPPFSISALEDRRELA